MISFSEFLDALAMFSFAFPTISDATAKHAGRIESFLRGVLCSFGGGVVRDSSMMLWLLFAGVQGLKFTILTSAPCWTGVLIAVLLLTVLKLLNKERVLKTFAVSWALTLIDGGGTAKFLCDAGRKCIGYGIYNGKAVVVLSFVTAIGGGFLNAIFQRERHKTIRKRIVPYSMWFLFSWVYYRLASAGCDGNMLTGIFILIGMGIAVIAKAFSHESTPIRIRRGMAFSFKIGLFISNGERFRRIKSPEKGRRITKLIPISDGDIVEASESL